MSQNTITAHEIVVTENLKYNMHLRNMHNLQFLMETSELVFKTRASIKALGILFHSCTKRVWIAWRHLLILAPGTA